MKEGFAVIGLGRFGGSICRSLVEQGMEVLAIDSDEERVNEYMSIATHAVIANSTDENALRQLGIRNFEHVIVAIGEDIQSSILTTLILKEMGVNTLPQKRRMINMPNCLIKSEQTGLSILSETWDDVLRITSYRKTC